MANDRTINVQDLLEVCDLCFRSLDILDRYCPDEHSDLIPPLLMTPMVVDSVLRELAKYELTAAQRSTAELLRKRLRLRREAILDSQPDELEGRPRH